MVLDLFRLDGQVALVTGGDKGLGQAMAVALAQAGADVAIVSRSGHNDATRAAIEAVGRRALALTADLGRPDAAVAVVEQVAQALGRIDILVNNAGIIRRAAALETELADFQAVLDVNLISVWALAQAAGRRMLAQGHGKIINIASLLAFQGGIRVPAYTASKHAVAGLTKALANEWAKHGINVNAIAPATWPPTTPRRYATTRSAAGSSWSASRPGGGAHQMIWLGRSCSSPRAPVTTSTAMSWWWMAAGWRGNRYAATRESPPICRPVLAAWQLPLRPRPGLPPAGSQSHMARRRLRRGASRW
jgi:2-deoxy-D-gluconate 3-dehydrogenase